MSWRFGPACKPPKHWSKMLKRIKWAVAETGYTWPRRVVWRFYVSISEVDKAGRVYGLWGVAETGAPGCFTISMAKAVGMSETLIHEVAHVLTSFDHNKTWGACYGALYGAYYDSSAGPKVPTK